MEPGHMFTIARCYLFEMARMIQFGGETLFVCLDGSSSEQPDQTTLGLPSRVMLGMEDGTIATFDLHSARRRGVNVHLYLETSRDSSLSTIERTDDTTLRFADGSILSGPHVRPVRRGDGEIVPQMFYKWTGGQDDDGGQARAWAEAWADHEGGIEADGDDEEQPH